MIVTDTPCMRSICPGAQDDERWHRADSDRYESEGEGERYEFGQECLDRIALALGGNTIVPLASSLLVTLLQVDGSPWAGPPEPLTALSSRCCCLSPWKGRRMWPHELLTALSSLLLLLVTLLQVGGMPRCCV